MGIEVQLAYLHCQRCGCNFKTTETVKEAKCPNCNSARLIEIKSA
ncbi:MAG: hypothetical protein JWQ87_5485 [Candidatus Sulfotelmatobacter sp.]|nr:hypothetical protein [Candidatus Sulfotelmatobacter sp.]